MVVLKTSVFLVAYTLVLCQMYCSQAAPARSDPRQPGLMCLIHLIYLIYLEITLLHVFFFYVLAFLNSKGLPVIYSLDVIG